MCPTKACRNSHVCARLGTLGTRPCREGLGTGRWGRGCAVKGWGRDAGDVAVP